MNVRGSDWPSGSGAGPFPAGRPLALARRSSAAPLPAYVAYLYVALLAAPALVSLPAGAPLALGVMLVGLPVWFEAARARRTPFDVAATRTIAIVLACAGFLIVWSLLSTFGATQPLRASRYLSTLVSGFAIYLLVRSTVTRQQILRYIDIIAAALAATALLSLIAYDIAPLHQMVFKGTDRAAGMFKNPNQFGMAISTTIPALMALLLSVRRRRPFRILCLFLILLGLLASGSKTNLMLAWASILTMLLAYAIVAYSGVRRIGMMALYLVVTLVMTGLGILALNVLNPRALGLLSQFLYSQEELESLMTRGFLWRYSIDQFLADPFLGQGASQRIDIFYRQADVSHSHNLFLDYMRTLGAPGLLSVAIMIGAVVTLCLWSIVGMLRATRGTTSARMICIGLSLSTLVYIAANMSSDSFGPSTSPYFWLFTYLAFAARRLTGSSSQDDLGRFPESGSSTEPTLQKLFEND